MIGTIAQIVALVSHGNNYLRTRRLDPEFFPHNTAFQFCNRVEFWATPPRRFFRANTELISTGPAEWFEYLRSSGADHLRFKYVHSAEKDVPDHKMAGFVGGGGNWSIEERVDDEYIDWRSRWELTREDSPEKRIWGVFYNSDLTRRNGEDNGPSVEAASERLDAVLQDIKRFAVSNNLGWVSHFETALQALSSQTPEVGFHHQDLLVPEVYSLAQRQLFYAAGLAWCFGGMGWWNDVWLESDELRAKHEQVSSELFDAINQSIAAVLNRKTN